MLFLVVQLHPHHHHAHWLVPGEELVCIHNMWAIANIFAECCGGATTRTPGCCSNRVLKEWSREERVSKLQVSLL